jgi:hypothetical protein
MSRPSAEIDRRQFLVGAITLAAAQLCPLGALAADPQDPGTEAEWRSVLMTLFPHPGLDPALYQPAAAALVAAAADPNVRALLAAGRASLAEAAGGAWGAADAAARTRAVATTVGTPLFVLLRQTAVFTFYNDPKVWAEFGYVGDAWSFGGWIDRGVDTIDWLPDPPPVE